MICDNDNHIRRHSVNYSVASVVAQEVDHIIPRGGDDPVHYVLYIGSMDEFDAALRADSLKPADLKAVPLTAPTQPPAPAAAP